MSLLVTKATIALASSLPNSNSSPPPPPPPPPPQPNGTPPVQHRIRTRRSPIPQQQQRLLQQKQKQKQPSVVEIERAIGAGMFRDRDPRESEENETMFDGLLPNSIGKNEGSVEKKLRETGEWVLSQSEGASRSSGKQVLIGLYLWTIPMGVLLLVASGVIKLPFSTPFLDDLIL